MADTICVVKAPLSSVLLLASLVYSSPLEAADDAYDDDAEDRGPRPRDDEEDDTGEMTDSGLQTGGMNAPNALGETGDQRSDIEKELEKSDRKDSGRGLQYFWLSADIGFQALSLNALNDGGLLAAGEPSGASGLVFGGAAGARVLYFSLGARFQYGNFSEFTPWSLLGEAALRVPLGKFEPYGLVGIGYAQVSGLGDVGRVDGVDVRLGGGLDYYLSDSFSVGAQVSGDVLFLSGATGTATGIGASGLALLSLHF